MASKYPISHLNTVNSITNFKLTLGSGSKIPTNNMDFQKKMKAQMFKRMTDTNQFN